MFKKNNPLLPYLSLLVAMLLWASSFVALKIAFSHYHPMVVIFFRMLTGSFCFGLCYKLFKGVVFNKKDFRLMSLMAFCEPCMYFSFEAKALVYTSASQAGMITAMMPILVSVAAFFVLGERMERKTIAGLLVSVLGAVWLSLAGKSSLGAPNPILGNFYEFLAMVCAAGYTVCLKKLTLKGYSPFFLTAFQAFAGSIFFFPALFFPSTTLPVTFEPVSVAAIIYLGAAVTLGAYGLYNYSLSRVSAGHAASFVNLIPVFALVLGILILDESLTLGQYIACSVVFFGLYLSREGKPKPAAILQPGN